jgi:hypothetical protein
MPVKSQKAEVLGHVLAIVGQASKEKTAPRQGAPIMGTAETIDFVLPRFHRDLSPLLSQKASLAIFSSSA